MASKPKPPTTAEGLFLQYISCQKSKAEILKECSRKALVTYGNSGDGHMFVFPDGSLFRVGPYLVAADKTYADGPSVSNPDPCTKNEHH